MIPLNFLGKDELNKPLRQGMGLPGTRRGLQESHVRETEIAISF